MENYRTVRVSKYSSIYSDQCDHIQLSDALESIKIGEVKETITRIRELTEAGNIEEANKEKSKLPAIVPSSLINGKRLSSNIEKYNQLISLDIDKLEKNEVAELKNRIASDPHVFSIFQSPRFGLRVLVFVDSEQIHHKNAFEQLSKYFNIHFGVTVDKQTSDVIRLSFLSYDPDIYVNWESIEFKVNIPVQVLAQELTTKIEESEKKSFLIANNILHFLKSKNKSITKSHQEWYKVAYALVNTFSRDVAENLFLKFCELDGENFDLKKCLYEFDYCYNNIEEDIIGFGTIIHFAKEQGFSLQPDEFFYKKKDGKLEISELGYLEFLSYSGFHSYRLENGNTIIRIKNQIIEAVELYDIKQFVMDYIRNLPFNLTDSITSRDLLSKVVSLKHILFNSASMEFLPKAELKIHKDTENSCFIYYKNGPVEITEENVKIISYENLDGSIWKKQILDREIVLSKDYRLSSFFQFIVNICGNDEDRIESLKSAIGYLVHRHKDPIQSKAIVFGDEKISDSGEANGGTGKSLVGDAISKIRNVVKIDGKNFNQRFLFQQISLETDIVQFDDVRKDFDFESLYPSITTGINVEKKGETPYVIPFEMAPKFEINTNYTIKGTGGNTEERRKFTIEFSDYYGPEKTPNEEFGHRFFKDWDPEAWSLFDNFIIHCVQIYLKNGLISYEHRTLKQRDFIARTSEDFSEFANNAIQHDCEYDLQFIHNKFLEAHPAYRTLSHRRFCKWIRHFIEVKNLKTYSMINGGEYFQKRNGKQYIKIVAPKIESDEETKK